MLTVTVQRSVSFLALLTPFNSINIYRMPERLLAYLHLWLLTRQWERTAGVFVLSSPSLQGEQCTFFSATLIYVLSVFWRQCLLDVQKNPNN